MAAKRADFPLRRFQHVLRDVTLVDFCYSHHNSYRYFFEIDDLDHAVIDIGVRRIIAEFNPEKPRAYEPLFDYSGDKVYLCLNGRLPSYLKGSRGKPKQWVEPGVVMTAWVNINFCGPNLEYGPFVNIAEDPAYQKPAQKKLLTPKSKMDSLPDNVIRFPTARYQR